MKGAGMHLKKSNIDSPAIVLAHLQGNDFSWPENYHSEILRARPNLGHFSPSSCTM